MGSSITHELALLVRDVPRDASKFRPPLLRLAGAMDERVKSSDASSLEFVRTAVRVLTKVGLSYNSDIQYRCFDSAVPYLYAHAELDAALLAARGMLVIGRQLKRKDLIRRGCNCLGIIDKSLGNFADAIVHFQEALQLSQELGDPQAELAVLGNLGGTFVEAGLCSEALRCFQRAESLYPAHLVLNSDRALSLVNLSLLYLRLGDLKSANQAARRSLRLWEEPICASDFVSRTFRKAL